MHDAMLDAIFTGDARALAAQIPDESVDFIFTDPVYERIEDYAWLAETAARILKPNRACLVWCSNRGQFAAKAAMEPHLTFVLPLNYTKVAKAHRAFGYKTFLAIRNSVLRVQPQYMITNIEFVVKNGRRSGLMTLHVKLRNHNA